MNFFSAISENSTDTSIVEGSNRSESSGSPSAAGSHGTFQASTNDGDHPVEDRFNEELNVAGPSHPIQPSSTKKIATGEQEKASEGSAEISVEGNNWLSYGDLMSESYPAKSKIVYLKAYKLFERFLKSKNQWKPDTVPSDLAVLNYFHHCKNKLKWAPTTLWSTYARINAVMKRVYGVSLNSYKRVGDVLKSYESGHVVKQAGIFSPQQIEDFVSDPELCSKYWLVRKAVCLIGYYGGFRNIELKSLKFENCELDSMGYWFQFARSKQRGRLEATSICIPRRQPDWIPVAVDSSRVGLDFDPASLIDQYLAEIQSDLECSRDELSGDFFRATHGPKGQKFTKLTLGKNTIGKVGVQVATELGLARPETFTGHCWRRSCGTSASDSGVNVTTLMSMMGWSNPKTAMVYVKKSRLTSLSMSLYLTNVQRTNCSNPFPRTPLEERRALNQAQAEAVLARGSKSSSETAVKSEELEAEQATQDLIHDLESEAEGGVGNIFGVDEVEVQSGASSVTNLCSGQNVETRKEGLVCKTEGGVKVEGSVPNQIPVLDSRIAGFLHNLHNTGNMNIHFHFDGNSK